jgi:hypothetical protein
MKRILLALVAVAQSATAQTAGDCRGDFGEAYQVMIGSSSRDIVWPESLSK